MTGVEQRGADVAHRSPQSIVAVVVLALLVAACGSRVEEGTGPSGLGPTTPGVTAPATGPEGATFGGLPGPCGPGDASGAIGVGVTADTITLGVITDRKSSFVPGLNEGLWHGMSAFATWCNEQGGIDGRTVELIEYDADIFSYRDRILEACQEVFALVGGGGIQDNLGAQDAVDCGMAEVAGITVNAKKTGADRVFEPLPNPAGTYQTGAGAYFLEEMPEIADRAGYLYTDIPIGSYQRDRHVQGYESIGYDFSYIRAAEINEENWKPIVLEMEREGVEYISLTSSPEEARNLLKAMADQQWAPKVMDLEANFYDRKLLDAAGADAEGIYVRIAAWPFEEAADNPATAQLVALLEGEADAKPSLLAAHSFSAGLLFATAASGIDGDLTRDALLEELATIHEWNGLGLHAPTDPGGKVPTPCFILLQVREGAYERVFPATTSDGDGGYACDDDSRVALDVDALTNYEPGARAG